MKISDLELFQAVVKQGSLTAAAKEVHISQPAASNAIKAMENELGMTLLNRTSGQRTSLGLTEAGSVFSAYCDDALIRYHHMQASLAQTGGESLSLSVCVTPTIGASVMPAFMQYFAQSYPRLVCSVRTTVETLTHPEQLLRSGNCDLVITPCEPKSSTLETKAFFRDAIIPVIAASYGAKAKLSLKELCAMPIIARPENSLNMQAVIKALKKHHISYDSLSIAMQVNGDSDVLTVVRSGAGVGFVTRSIYETSSAKEEIIPLEVEGFTIDRFLYLVQRRNQVSSYAIDTFRKYADSSLWRGGFGFQTQI